MTNKGLFPTDAPGDEAQGAVSKPGFVKYNPANNDHYVEQMQADPWYRIIKRTHDALTALIPGYNITQIKEKFGGLRYYIDYPEGVLEAAVNPERPWLNTVEKVRDRAEGIIRYAEAWVDGYEFARREEREKNAGT